LSLRSNLGLKLANAFGVFTKFNRRIHQIQRRIHQIQSACSPNSIGVFTKFKLICAGFLRLA